MRELGQALVEIHGQHDDRALIDPSGHRELVDAFGGLSGAAGSGRRGLGGLESGRGRADPSRGEIAAIRANADYVGHALEELAELVRKVAKRKRSLRAAS